MQVGGAECRWRLSADLWIAKALVWVASGGRQVDLTSEANRFFFDRYSRLAAFYRRAGKPAKAKRYQARADAHYETGFTDGPPYAAAMAMPRPRGFIRTEAIGRRFNGPDDAA